MEDNNNIEHLFNDGMKSHEVPYQEGSWEKMEELLEKEDRRPLWIIWFGKRNNQLKTILIMTVVGIIAAWSIFNLFGINESREISKSNTIIESEIVTEEFIEPNKGFNSENLIANSNEKSEAKSMDDEASSEVANGESSPLESPLIDQRSVSSQLGLGVNGQTLAGSKSISGSGKTSSASLDKDGNLNQEDDDKKTRKVISATKDILKVAKSADSIAKLIINRVDTTTVVTKVIKVEHKEWVEDRYTYNYNYDPSKPIKDFWMGIHYTEQAAAGQFNLRRSGFNLQLMSGNIAKNKEKHALYAGLDWGMMFYGRSANTNVVINTVNEDSGYTRLRNNSTDFFFRMHYEYPKHRIVPYFTLNAGPRLYYTNQKVASYLNLADNESQTRHNADLTVSMMAGLGIGTRIKIVDRISLDLRYERMFGTKTKQVDLNQTTFNGLSYNLVRNDITPNNQLFKVGLIFDLSEDRKEEELIEGHYVTVSRDSVVVENTSDTTVIVLPCDCSKKSKKQTSTQDSKEKDCDDDEEETEEDKETLLDILLRSGSGSGNSGSGSSGKGSFPGVKSKPPVLK